MLIFYSFNKFSAKLFRRIISILRIVLYVKYQLFGPEIMDDTNKAIGLCLIGIVGLVVLWTIFAP